MIFVVVIPLVSVLQAIIAALIALELSMKDGEHILEVTKTRVDLVARYQGKNFIE